jgi:hypothetical protein
VRASASEHQMSVAFLREERHIIEEYYRRGKRDPLCHNLILSLASEPLAADKARQAISRGLALVFRFSGFSAPPREHESESVALKPPHCFRGGVASKPAVE